jgi:hypothetical protein
MAQRAQAYFIKNQNAFVAAYNQRNPHNPLEALSDAGVCNGLTLLYLQHKNAGTIEKFNQLVDQVNQTTFTKIENGEEIFDYDQMTEAQIDEWANLCRNVSLLQSGSYENTAQMSVKHKLGLEMVSSTGSMAYNARDLKEVIENIPVGHAALITTSNHIFSVTKTLVRI